MYEKKNSQQPLNLMEKIAILGSPGAGKTTLARNLSRILNIKVRHLDRLFWQSDWGKKTRDDRIDILQNLVQEQRWIIEGTYINSSKIHLHADTIIFLDIPIFVCLWHVIKRHYVHQDRTRRDIPEGCTDKLSLLLILEVLFFPFQERIKLKMNLRKCSSKKVIIRLYSLKEVKIFLTNPELYVYKYKQSVKKRSVLKRVFVIIFDRFLQRFYLSANAYDKALNIQKQSQGVNHPNITPIYNQNSLQ